MMVILYSHTLTLEIVQIIRTQSKLYNQVLKYIK